jgi:hypothetical protein
MPVFEKSKKNEMRFEFHCFFSFFVVGLIFLSAHKDATEHGPFAKGHCICYEVSVKRAGLEALASIGVGSFAMKSIKVHRNFVN